MQIRFSKSFGQAVRRARLRHNLSQERLAELVEVHRNYIGLLERGERGISLDLSEALATALEIPIERLVKEAADEWRALPSRVKRPRSTRTRP